MAGREKTFYFLKLEKDFFEKKEIKILRKISGGDTFTIIYLKMLLMALADEGVFYFENIGENIAEEVALVIDENLEDVAVTISFLQKKGLLEIVEVDKYYLNSTPEMVGQVTSHALRQRRYMERQKIKASQSDGKALEYDTSVMQSDVEIEKEKEIELEEEIEKKFPTAEISNYYQKRIGIIDGQQYQILTDYLTLDGMEPEVIKTAIDKAADNGKRSFSYINSILKNWRQNGIRTMVQVEDEQRQFQQKKQGQSDDDIQDPFIH